jgi:hypothetical protein
MSENFYRLARQSNLLPKGLDLKYFNLPENFLPENFHKMYYTGTEI